MRLIFVDDSQQRDPPRAGLGPLIALGGVVIPDTAVRTYAEGFANLRQSLNIPVGEEVKWNPNRGSYMYQQADGDLVNTLERGCLTWRRSARSRPR